MTVQIHSTLKKQGFPNIDFTKIKNHILGKQYELHVLICSDKLARSINKKYRNKDYVPNTLSFPYSQNSGEIILNIHKSNKEARHFKHSKTEHFLFLYIHSLLHLKGYTHGHKMEKEEKKLLNKFK